MHILQISKNADHLLAKIGVDTTENEPEVRIQDINDICPRYLQPRNSSASSRRAPEPPAMRKAMLVNTFTQHIGRHREKKRVGALTVVLKTTSDTEEDAVASLSM